ncbi:hypothetical protein Sjap_007979 [Stephania japonica]|uniref:Uncharacterized protein n=1 Tax=Stephania japonica TaxID=461633 RepID=A0AAP0JQV6_9MAGN
MVSMFQWPTFYAHECDCAQQKPTIIHILGPKPIYMDLAHPCLGNYSSNSLNGSSSFIDDRVQIYNQTRERHQCLVTYTKDIRAGMLFFLGTRSSLYNTLRAMNYCDISSPFTLHWGSSSFIDDRVRIHNQARERHQCLVTYSKDIRAGLLLLLGPLAPRLCCSAALPHRHRPDSRSRLAPRAKALLLCLIVIVPTSPSRQGSAALPHRPEYSLGVINAAQLRELFTNTELLSKNFVEMLAELSRREIAANIKPDLDLDVYMKILGLDICADTMVGNEMIRGISGGQKKRVTTGKVEQIKLL